MHPLDAVETATLPLAQLLEVTPTPVTALHVPYAVDAGATTTVVGEL
jgi:hypothetical protein